MMKNELKRYLGNKKTTTTTQRINDDLKRKKKGASRDGSFDYRYMRVAQT
jgi:hypothetical protein